MKVVPIKKRFENWRALLAHVAEDAESIGAFVVTFTADGRMKAAHSGETLQGHMALAAAYWLKRAAEDF